MGFKNKHRAARFLQRASGIFSNDSASGPSVSSLSALLYPELNEDVNMFPALIGEKHEALEAGCPDGKSRLDSTSVLQASSVQ